MSLQDIDALIHSPKRLAAMAMMNQTGWVEFAFIRDTLSLTDSDLSKQMSQLVDAGYVKVKKSGLGRGGVTWFALTPAGRAAFDRHREALRALVDTPAKPPTS